MSLSFGGPRLARAFLFAKVEIGMQACWQRQASACVRGYRGPARPPARAATRLQEGAGGINPQSFPFIGIMGVKGGSDHLVHLLASLLSLLLCSRVQALSAMDARPAFHGRH